MPLAPGSRRFEDREAIPGHLQRQNAAAVSTNCCSYAAGSALFDQKNYAASTSGSADLCRSPSVPGRNRNQFVDQ